MYFCPCSCSKADGENEEDVLIYLPRNLSYAGESYLDRFSVSSAFVHNGKLEKQLLQSDVDDHYLKVSADAATELQRLKLDESDSDSECVSGARAMARPVACTEDTLFRGGPDNCDVREAMSLSSNPSSTPIPVPTSSHLPPLAVSIDRDNNSESQSDFERYVVKTVESPDSDLVSEEGIFVNMTDDLDGLGAGPGGKSTLSEASDDTYVSGDSMYYSPVEADDMEEEEGLGQLDFQMSLEEAIQQVMQSPIFPPSLADSEHSPDDVNSSEETSTDPQAPDNDIKTEERPASDTNGEAAAASDNTLQAVSASDNTLQAVSASDNNLQAVSASDNNLQAVSASSSSADCAPNGNCAVPVIKEPRKTVSNLEINDKASQGEVMMTIHDFLSAESPVYEDSEFNFTRAELRKSTSLKSTKTPPGTPRRKKVVRFADAMGLDLESVRHVLNLESPPKIPPSAMKDLQMGLSEDRKSLGTKYITETFPQPGADMRFRERVLADKVVLENALVVSGSITGVVRVANISFHKAVRVRFTTNDWASFHDIAASYMINSNDGTTDRFSFTIVPPPDFGPGSRLQCAISYSVNGVDFWDNNKGNNYVFECYAKTVPTEAENAWMHFL